jgi:uncharacterized membrane-anchored protein YjiN (DUF445 family)
MVPIIRWAATLFLILPLCTSCTDGNATVTISGNVDTTKKGINISQEVESRYPSADAILKSFYVKILAFFNPISARTIIEQDMDNETEVNQMISLLRAFSATGINDDYVVNKLEEMIYHTIPNSNFHPVEKEVLSTGIAIDLAKSNRDDRFDKLIDIAATTSFSDITRATALSELYCQLESDTTADKSHIKSRLEQLRQDVGSSQTLKQDEKDFLDEHIMQILNSLQGV